MKRNILLLILFFALTVNLSMGQSLDPLQGGENVVTAFILNGSLPIVSSGTTAGYLDDYNEECEFPGSGAPDVVYSYTPSSGITVDVDLCGSSYDTRLYIYENSVTPGNPFACSDDFYFDEECGFYVSKIENATLSGGFTYYLVIDGYDETSYGNYIMTISEPGGAECTWGTDLSCPAWAVEESESCGVTSNEGCDMPPGFEDWETVPSTGATFCGTTFADGMVSDADWYELVLTVPSAVTLTADADHSIVFGLAETTTPGAPLCSTLTGEVNPSVLAGPCSESFIDLGILTPGTYWLIVERGDDGISPCESHYRIEFAVSPQGCPAPEALSATGITASAADLGWIETGTASSWEYQVGPALFDPAETGVITAMNPVTVSGLDANSGYDFYVRSVCGETSSPWTGPFTFTTACSGTVAMPWAESFEGTWPPACWTDTETQDYGWAQSTYGTERSGNEWAYCNKAGSALTSPPVTLTTDTWLVFWYRAENAENPQDLAVSIGENVIYQVIGSTSESYLEVNVSLAAYTGQTIALTFTGGSGTGGTDAGICLDDVSVKPEYRWTGNLSTNWNDPGNWSLPDIPDQDGIVIIPTTPSGGFFPEINTGINAECYNISVFPGASVSVKTGATLQVSIP